MALPVQLRRARPSDAAAVAAFMAEDDIVFGTLQMPFANEPMWHDRLSVPESPQRLVLLAEDDLGACGIAGLAPLNDSPRQAHVRELVITVASRAHGKGVGSALMSGLTQWADLWAQVKRIELRVNVDNERAIALYKKFGFVQEGILRGECFRAGEYVDVYAMARLCALPR